jgi:superfamily I DNA and/or RNA helicase
VQVLVTAASNAAVDNLAERLMDATKSKVLRVCKTDRLNAKVGVHKISKRNAVYLSLQRIFYLIWRRLKDFRISLISSNT